MAELTGRIFNIQSYSVHDGPGIRTVCFLKGCPLRCKWCSNPESQKGELEIAWDARKCRHCQACVQSCDRGALRVEGEVLLRDAERCADCAGFNNGSCVNACLSRALFPYGRVATVGEVLAQVEEDGAFYGRSGGGLTLSGGEALQQPEFAIALLRQARERGIHTCMETTLFAPERTVLEACGHLDYLIADIKHMDSALHRHWTGVPNERILRNLRRVRHEYPDLPMLIRTPLVPGVNDSGEQIGAIAGFVKNLHDAEYELLPYHALGAQKYSYLGRDYQLGEIRCEAGRTASLQKLADTILGHTQQSDEQPI